MKRFPKYFWLVMIWLLWKGTVTQAGPDLNPQQEFDPVRDVPVETILSHSAYSPGMEGEAVVLYHVPDHFHITALENGLFYVEYDTVEAIHILSVDFPPGEPLNDEGNVFRGTVPVRVRFRIDPGTREDFTYSLRAGYQVCRETGVLTCFMPVEKEQVLNFHITKDRSEIHRLESPYFTAGSDDNPGGTSLEDRLKRALSGNILLALLFTFLGGLLSSFTPCVYPVIPVTVSYIGAHSGKSKFSGFYLSLFFVLGMALVYSILGVVAAASGGSFGAMGQTATVQFIIAGIFIVLAASMFGAYEIQLPSSWLGKMQSGARSGVLGAVFMGGITGFIAAPCVGPVIGVLLIYIAGTGNLLMGFLLMLFYALGMGVLFLVIGTFAGALNSLPQAGAWMDTIKHFFGVVMVFMALYFIRLYVPEALMWILLGIWFIVVAVYTGAFDRLEGDAGFGERFYKSLGVIFLVLGLYFLSGGLLKTWSPGLLSGAVAGIATTTGAVDEVEVEWSINNPDEVFARAAAEGKPVMMDFYADWCAACKELDEKTYNVPELVEVSHSFLNLKMDFTRANSGTWEKEMRDKYHIVGMPTVILFTPDGREYKRFMGFKKAKEVLPLMREVLAQSR